MVVHEVAIWLTRERPKVKPSSRKYGADMCASPASSAWVQVQPHHTRSCTMSAHNQVSTSDSLIERGEKRHAAPTITVEVFELSDQAVCELRPEAGEAAVGVPPSLRVVAVLCPCGRRGSSV